MFGWFKSKEQKEREELARFTRWKQIEDEANKKAEQDRLKHEEELRQAAKKLEEEKLKALKESEEPWCEWVAQGKDINGRTKVALDWNTAWIDYIRNECGFEGDEEAVVVRYLAALAKSQWEDTKNESLNLFHQLPESASAKDAPEDK